MAGRLMVGLSCSGLECAFFVVAIVVFFVVVGAMAILAGLVATESVRLLTRRVGWTSRDLALRVGAFIGAMFLVGLLVGAMDGLAIGPWIGLATATLSGLFWLYRRLRKINRKQQLERP